MKHNYAPEVYKLLHGIFCVYKPPDKAIQNVIKGAKSALAKELNGMAVRPMRPRVIYSDEVAPTATTDIPSQGLVVAGQKQLSSTPEPLSAQLVPDLSDHPLVVGPRYTPDDFHFKFIDALSSQSSGVSLMSIGLGMRALSNIRHLKYMRVYHVTGEFGKSTQDHTPQGHLVEKTTYFHINRDRLERVTSGIQAGQQRQMFSAAGVDLRSQEAYELAAKGLVRALSHVTQPLVYNMKIIDFNLPNFTLEIHCINETCHFLRTIIHEIGLVLRSSAVCSKIRRIRYGPFTLDHTLLDKHLLAENILDNIRLCDPLCSPEKKIVSPRFDVLPEKTDLAKFGELLSQEDHVHFFAKDEESNLKLLNSSERNFVGNDEQITDINKITS